MKRSILRVVALMAVMVLMASGVAWASAPEIGPALILGDTVVDLNVLASPNVEEVQALINGLIAEQGLTMGDLWFRNSAGEDFVNVANGSTLGEEEALTAVATFINEDLEEVAIVDPAAEALAAAEEAVAAYEAAPVTTLEEVAAAEELGATALDLVNALDESEDKAALLERIAARDAVVAAAQEELTPLTIQSASVVDPKSIEITFNKPVADTEEITFNVKRGPIGVALSVDWNEEGTVATLSASTKLVAGDYTIEVLEGDTVVDAVQQIVEKEHVAKIEFLSEMIIRTSDIQGQVGFVVYNQYGEDITNSALARSINWSCSADSIDIDYKAGVITITHGTVDSVLNQLRNLDTVVVTAYTQDPPVVVSESLKVSETKGGIAAIELLAVEGEDGSTIIYGDDTNKDFFIAYEAYDQYGNPVDSYSMLSSADSLMIYSSNPAVDVQVVQDPDNSRKALFKVTLNNTINLDTPVVFTAVAPATGASDSLQIEILKPVSLHSFTIETPSELVAQGETVEIPYTALDQYGNEITDYNKLDGLVSFDVTGTGVQVIEERTIDGKYKLYLEAADAATVGRYYITATVPGTGSVSQVAVDIEEMAVPEAIKVIYADEAFAPDAGEYLDFYYGYIKLSDQYDRSMSLAYDNVFDGYHYYVVASTSDAAITLTSDKAYLTNAIQYSAVNVGNATVTFKLVKDVDETFGDDEGEEILDVTTVDVTVVDKKDIVEYYMTGPSKPIFATGSWTYTDGTDVTNWYDEDLSVYGRLADGTRVLLPSSDVLAYVVSDSRFTMNGDDLLATDLGTDEEATVTVTATVLGANGELITVSKEFTASTERPVAKDIYDWISYEWTVAGRKVRDTYYMNTSDFNNLILNKSLFYFDNGGAAQADSYNDYVFVFEIYDSYGNYGLKPAYATISTVSGTTQLDIDPDTGIVTLADAMDAVDNGDEFVISAVTNNGLIHTVRIKIDNSLPNLYTP